MGTACIEERCFSIRDYCLFTNKKGSPRSHLLQHHLRHLHTFDLLYTEHLQPNLFLYALSQNGIPPFCIFFNCKYLFLYFKYLSL